MVNTLLEWWQEAPYKVLFYLKQPAEQNEKIPIMGHIIINRIISYSFVANDLSHSDWGDTKAKSIGFLAYMIFCPQTIYGQHLKARYYAKEK